MVLKKSGKLMKKSSGGEQAWFLVQTSTGIKHHKNAWEGFKGKLPEIRGQNLGNAV